MQVALLQTVDCVTCFSWASAESESVESLRSLLSSSVYFNRLASSLVYRSARYADKKDPGEMNVKNVQNLGLLQTQDQGTFRVIGRIPNQTYDALEREKLPSDLKLIPLVLVSTVVSNVPE